LFIKLKAALTPV